MGRRQPHRNRHDPHHLDWPPILSALVFVAAVAVLALAADAATRALAGGVDQAERKALAGSVIFWARALHGG